MAQGGPLRCITSVNAQYARRSSLTANFARDSTKLFLVPKSQALSGGACPRGTWSGISRIIRCLPWMQSLSRDHHDPEILDFSNLILRQRR
jgi:hypothetical protein